MFSFTIKRIISAATTTSTVAYRRTFHQQSSSILRQQQFNKQQIKCCIVRQFGTSEATAASPASSSKSDRDTGTVKRFSKEKGFGFITRTSDGSDIFVHFKNISGGGFKTLEEGQQVEFTVSQGDKGQEAKDVNIVDNPFGGSTSKSQEQSSTSSMFSSSSTSSATSAFGSQTTPSSASDRSSILRSVLQDRETGSVKRWTKERGFGFIRRSSGGTDLFVHVRNLKDGVQELEEGQQVEFKVQLTEKR